MAKVLVLTHSFHGHVEAMAKALAEGATAVGAQADARRVPETVSEEATRKSRHERDQDAPAASVAGPKGCDAIVVGAGTQCGRIPAQMAAFLRQTGGSWQRDALEGEVGAAFTSTAARHGDQETALVSTINNPMHLGMVTIGLPCGSGDMSAANEVVGDAPYGATTIANGDGSRQPPAIEPAGARYQRTAVTRTATRLFGC